MFKPVSNEIRRIVTFPEAYKHDKSPYEKSRFSDRTKQISQAHLLNFQKALNVCKVIILGDLSVGKTCIVNRFCHETFESGYKATIGVDFEVEKFDVLGVPFYMQIWDTAGQERFKCIAQSYYRSAHAIIVVFDFTKINSLSNCKQWLREAKSVHGNEEALVFLVGTKKDLLVKGVFESVKSSSQVVATSLGAEFWAVSSRTGQNIEKMFLRIAALIFDRIFDKEPEEYDVNIESDLVSFKKNSPPRHRNKCNINCKTV